MAEIGGKAPEKPKTSADAGKEAANKSSVDEKDFKKLNVEINDLHVKPDEFKQDGEKGNNKREDLPAKIGESKQDEENNDNKYKVLPVTPGKSKQDEENNSNHDSRNNGEEDNNKSGDSENKDGKNKLDAVPSIVNEEFEKWFDDLTNEEFDKVWNDKTIKAESNKTLRDSIKDRLRAHGGMHEWYMVSRANIFKKWGVKAKEIWDNRTETTEVKFVNPGDGHGKKGSTTAHNEILKIIDYIENNGYVESKNFAEVEKNIKIKEFVESKNLVQIDKVLTPAEKHSKFKEALCKWADCRLGGGAGNLPSGLQK